MHVCRTVIIVVFVKQLERLYISFCFELTRSLGCVPDEMKGLELYPSSKFPNYLSLSKQLQSIHLLDYETILEFQASYFVE
jgi:hypothetical protein